MKSLLAIVLFALLLFAGACFAQDSLNVRLAGRYDTGGYAFGVYVSGSYAYVADGGDGLRIIDVSVPSSPYEIGFYNTGDTAYGVYVSGSYAYVADYEDGLRVKMFRFCLRLTRSAPTTRETSPMAFMFPALMLMSQAGLIVFG